MMRSNSSVHRTSGRGQVYESTYFQPRYPAGYINHDVIQPESIAKSKLQKKAVVSRNLPANRSEYLNDKGQQYLKLKQRTAAYEQDIQNLKQSKAKVEAVNVGLLKKCRQLEQQLHEAQQKRQHNIRQITESHQLIIQQRQHKLKQYQDALVQRDNKIGQMKATFQGAEKQSLSFKEQYTKLQAENNSRISLLQQKLDQLGSENQHLKFQKKTDCEVIQKKEKLIEELLQKVKSQQREIQMLRLQTQQREKVQRAVQLPHNPSIWKDSRELQVQVFQDKEIPQQSKRTSPLKRPSSALPSPTKKTQAPSQFISHSPFNEVLNSHIAMTQGQRKNLSQILETRLGKPDSQFRLHLLFHAKIQRFSAEKFHDYCDGTPGLLVLCRSSAGKVCGGYTEHQFVKQESSRTGGPSGSFLFNLNQNVVLNLLPGQKAVTWVRENGPTFGQIDFYIRKDKAICNNYGLNSYEKMSTADIPGMQTLTGNFEIGLEDYEVYKVTLSKT